MAKRPLVPPDGGWGWMVVLGVAVCNATTQSLLSVFGLLFADTLAAMHEATMGAAVIGNSMVAVTNFSGLLVGPVMRRFSCRQVSMAGGALVALGMLLTVFATASWHLLLSYSLLVGVGLGLLNPATFVAVNAYFVRSRGRAVGLAMTGTGLGQMFMPHAVRLLLDAYGFRGAVLVLSAVALHSLPGAALFHPLHWHAAPAPAPDAAPDTQNKEGGAKEGDESAQQLLSPPAKAPSKEIGLSSGGVEDKSLLKSEKEPVGAAGGAARRWALAMGLDLMADGAMASLLAGLAAVYASGVTFNMLFPFLLADAGLARPRVALCMSLQAAMDVASRLLLPFITDRARVPARTTFLAGALAIAAARSLLALQRGEAALLATAALVGLVRGATTVNLNLAISESLAARPHRLPAALGINMVLKGVAIVIAGFFIGWLRDTTDSFTLCVHVLSLAIVLPMLIWLGEMAAARRHR